MEFVLFRYRDFENSEYPKLGNYSYTHTDVGINDCRYIFESCATPETIKKADIEIARINKWRIKETLMMNSL